MKNGINKKLLFLIIFLLISMTFVVYVTYAYYIAEVAGNESESTVAVTGGSLTINYQNNSEDIVAEKIMPGWNDTKSFTITATIDYKEEYKKNIKVWYDMLLVIDRNDFLTGSLEYMLSPINSDVSKEGIFIDDTYKPIPKGINTEGMSMGSGYLPNDTTSHTYNLSLRYLDRDEIDQISEMDAIFNARVNVKGSNPSTLTIDLNGGTLSNFSLDTSNKSKIAKDSEIYIPSPIKDGYVFNGWEITSGTGTTTGNNLVATSSSITIKAIYSTPPFTNDSWATIATNVKSGNTSKYKVGDTKKVAIGGTNYTVRVANNTTPSECSTPGFSQTACGFVVEFVDIVEKRAMNSDMTNVGGWPATEMRNYLNGEFLAKLPSDLQSVIADTTTTVVSGHGSNDSSNFTSTDKLYLLSTKEVWGDGVSNDTATGSTRQLEYYANNNVTTSNYSGAIKNYSGAAAWWWLRAADSIDDITFLYVYSSGDWYSNDASLTGGGVAPAFRIG